MWKSILLASIAWVLMVPVSAQKIITIDEALEIALKNNFDITIARSEAMISKTNNSAGTAGMLPNIDITGSGNYARKQISDRVSSDEEFTVGNSGITTWNAGAELSWTIFDGGKMFVTKSKLNEIEALGEIQYKQQVLQSLSEVIAAYYNVVKQKQQLAAIGQNIRYNEERVKIAEVGFNTGSKDKTNLLQARIDLNVNRQNALAQETAITSARRELARLLASDNDSDFEVSSKVEFNYTPDKDDLNRKLYSQNNTILAYQKQLSIEQLALKESYRSLLPKLNMSGGYYFQNIGTTDLETDNLSTRRTLWPQVGASVSIPVFMGGSLQRKVALSKINVDLAQYDLENLKLQVNTELQNALTSFESQQKLLDIEQENYELAKENLEIVLQQMRLGEATSLEVRTAQSDFEASSTRLTNFQYNLKMAETKLKQLMGEL